MQDTCNREFRSMQKKAGLVCRHLEHISVRALDQYQSIIRAYVRHREGVYALYRKRRLYYVGLASDLKWRLAARGASADSEVESFRGCTGCVCRIGAWRWGHAGNGRSKRICGSHTRSWPQRRGIRFTRRSEERRVGK